MQHEVCNYASMPKYIYPCDAGLAYWDGYICAEQMHSYGVKVKTGP